MKRENHTPCSKKMFCSSQLRVDEFFLKNSFPSIFIIKSDNVILFKVFSKLDLYNLERYNARIFLNDASCHFGQTCFHLA